MGINMKKCSISQYYDYININNKISIYYKDKEVITLEANKEGLQYFADWLDELNEIVYRDLIRNDLINNYSAIEFQTGFNKILKNEYQDIINKLVDSAINNNKEDCIRYSYELSTLKRLLDKYK